MIVIFGASTDIGQRLIARLHSAQIAYRAISRSGATPADLKTGNGVADAMNGADIVVSCAHARFTADILGAAPPAAQLILMGSAWRYSKVPNERADRVREAEALFLADNHCGVMLHSTLIYGGNQENNIRRLLKLIRRIPVIPAPGGGRQIVCPIYIDDLVDCLFAAATRHWDGKNVIDIAGPPLTWREMVQISARSIGLHRTILTIPARPFVVALGLLNRMGLNFLDPDILRRFSEDTNISINGMRDLLAVNPRRFEIGMTEAVRTWQREGLI